MNQNEQNLSREELIEGQKWIELQKKHPYPIVRHATYDPAPTLKKLQNEHQSARELINSSILKTFVESVNNIAKRAFNFIRPSKAFAKASQLEDRKPDSPSAEP